MPQARAYVPQLQTPTSAQYALAQRTRDARVSLGLKQSTLATRAGVTLPTLRRFEQTGEVSLKYLVRIVHALGRIDEFENLLRPPPAATMAELESRRPPTAKARVPMRKLTVQLRLSPTSTSTVGQLAELDRRIYFEYDTAFLARNLQLSPFKWPLRPSLIEHTDRAFGPLPGLIEDSLPDGWGLLLMNRAFRRRGLDPATVSHLDRLAYLGTSTMGALTYHPPADAPRDPQLLDLHELGNNARQIYSGEAVEVLPALARAGGSPAGARPKVLVGLHRDQILSGEDDLPTSFEHWIVKFSAAADARDAGPMEFAYSNMARAAGIDMPPTRLFNVTRTTSHFAVQRFDRAPGNARRHVHTFANLIHANFRIPSTDYADLLKVTAALTRNHQDLLRAFRQMAFNIAAHNRDDHAKNFAFIMNDLGEWTLSPAYDLCFSQGPAGEHTLSIAGEARTPTRTHILQLARQFDLKPKDATTILDQVNTATTNWPRFADQAGCTKKITRHIQSHIRPL